MNPTLPDTSPEALRDLAAADAHESLRGRFMPVLLDRPDAEAIFARVHAGDELRIEFRPADRAFACVLIGSQRIVLSAGTLDGADAATLDLANAAGLALTAALNAEEPEKRRELARAMAGASFVVSLRLNMHSETLVLHASDPTGGTVYCSQRVAKVDRRMALH
jgi:hypothetical protein